MMMDDCAPVGWRDVGKSRWSQELSKSSEQDNYIDDRQSDEKIFSKVY